MIHEDDARKMRDDLAQSLMQYTEVIDVMVDAAKGMRAKLEADGWSPTVAEQVAGTWLIKVINS